MSWSRFITVENLCIASEVTAAMLLLAFAFPEKRTKAKASPDDEVNRALLDLARRAFLEEKIAKSLTRLAMVECSRPAPDCVERLDSEFGDAESLGWIDRLSGTYNRTFIDIFLKRWLALPSDNRLGSYLSMVSLKDYAELVRDSGPVQVELMLRDLGNRLKSQFADQALVARLPPDRFLILTFDADPTVGVKCIESASEVGADPGATPETQPKSLALISSVVELSDELPSFEDAVSQLETGIDAATQAGENCFIKQGSQWTSDIPSQPARSRLSTSQPNVSSSKKSKEKSPTGATMSEVEASSDSSAKSSDPTISEESDSQLETASESSGDEELDEFGSNPLETPAQGKSADVSAVASNEEIAALFAQIKKNENQDGKSKDATVDNASKTSSDLTPDVSPESISNMTDTDSVSADDIASLFAAVKPVEPKSKSAGVAELDSMSDTATADDISALFKAVQEEKRDSDTSQVKPRRASNKPSAEESEDLSASASTDDIAELFKAVQSSQEAAKISTQVSPSPSIDDFGESATADDIAELFATVRQESKVRGQSESPKGIDPVSPQSKKEAIAPVDLQETASEDDIAALFAQMKANK